MKVRITKSHKYAHKGIHVREYAAGDEVETDDQAFVETGLREKYLEVVEESKKAAPKSAAPKPPKSEAKSAAKSKPARKSTKKSKAPNKGRLL